MRCSGKSLPRSTLITDQPTVPSAAMLWSLRVWGNIGARSAAFWIMTLRKGPQLCGETYGRQCGGGCQGYRGAAKSIRDMLKEGKLEIAKDSVIFLKCEICGAKISSGKYCPKCEMNYHHDLEEMARKVREGKVEPAFQTGALVFYHKGMGEASGGF